MALKDVLKKVQSTVEGLRKAEGDVSKAKGKSDEMLYAAYAEALKFYDEAEQVPTEYEALLKEYGLLKDAESIDDLPAATKYERFGYAAKVVIFYDPKKTKEQNAAEMGKVRNNILRAAQVLHRCKYEGIPADKVAETLKSYVSYKKDANGNVVTDDNGAPIEAGKGREVFCKDWIRDTRNPNFKAAPEVSKEDRGSAIYSEALPLDYTKLDTEGATHIALIAVVRNGKWVVVDSFEDRKFFDPMLRAAADKADDATKAAEKQAKKDAKKKEPKAKKGKAPKAKKQESLLDILKRVAAFASVAGSKWASRIYRSGDYLNVQISRPNTKHSPIGFMRIKDEHVQNDRDIGFASFKAHPYFDADEIAFTSELWDDIKTVNLLGKFTATVSKGALVFTHADTDVKALLVQRFNKAKKTVTKSKPGMTLEEAITGVMLPPNSTYKDKTITVKLPALDFKLVVLDDAKISNLPHVSIQLNSDIEEKFTGSDNTFAQMGKKAVRNFCVVLDEGSVALRDNVSDEVFFTIEAPGNKWVDEIAYHGARTADPLHECFKAVAERATDNVPQYLYLQGKYIKIGNDDLHYIVPGMNGPEQFQLTSVKEWSK